MAMADMGRILLDEALMRRPRAEDALGRMVEKAAGSTYTQIVYGPSGRFARMNGPSLLQAYIPLPRAQAVYTSNGLAYYRHFDHLGSSRLATTPNRALYSSTAYAPYGEPYAQAGNTDLSFTGQEPDTMSVTNGTTPAMYDFLMRKNSPVQGRWLSPDPAGLAAADFTSPQTLNRYAYVANSPLSGIDPLGLKRDPDDRMNANFFLGGSNLGGNCTIDGLSAPCSEAVALLESGGGINCSTYCNVPGLKVEPNGDMYGRGYNPGTFECGLDTKVCTPTNWMSVYLGNGGDLPAGINCVYIGGICDVPLGWRARAVLGSKVLQTAAATMNDARTIMGWYAASALAGLAMPEAAGVTDYDTYVIGRFPDVAPWNDVPFTKVLNMVDWDPVANVEWVSEGIANGNTFTLASPLSQATIDAVYSSEVNQVIWDGAYTISPGQYLLLVP